MFSDYSQYPKERVRVFFKYLANAATRHVRTEKRAEISKAFSPQVYREIDRIAPLQSQEVLKEVKTEKILSDERKEELETKIKVFYSHNQFLPYEIKLKKLKLRVKLLKRHKGSLAKIRSLNKKIVLCETLLKNLKKSDISGH